MKRKLIIILSILYTSHCLGQDGNCTKTTDTFYYINVSIWAEKQYPIFMDAVSKKLNLDSLSFKSVDEFLESLYASSFYISQIPNGNRKAIISCFGDSLGRQYLKENELKLNSIGSSIKRNSRTIKHKLATKEDVTIKVSKISGSFFVVNKSSALLLSNSNEVPLTDVKNISICYIPLNVQIKKEKRKRR